MKTITLEITSLAHGGAGLGRHDGKVYFVPLTAPGDRVRVSIDVEKKSYGLASLQEIVTPSPHRTLPACPLYGECGGCSLQHLTYESQVAAKNHILKGLLLKHLPDPAECLVDMVPAPSPLGYRTRVQLKVRSLPSGLAIGFYRRGSHHVVDLPDHCPIASSPINDLLPRLRQLLSTFGNRDRIPQVDLVHGDDTLVHLTFHCLGGVEPLLAEHLALYVPGAAGHLGGVHFQAGRKESFRTFWGRGDLQYTVTLPPDGGSHATTLSFGADGFSQVNAEVNNLLVASVAALVRQEGGGRLLDLYCGNGNLSLPLAHLVTAIEGVESFPPSIDSARANAVANGVGSARFHVAPAESFPRLAGVGTGFDIALLDPPREGARPAVMEIVTAAIPCVIYVSCDPATLARDAGILARGGYRLISFKGFDMFPQTHHIETLACFRLER